MTYKNVCDDCGKQFSSAKSIVWFKGKFRCNSCKLRAGNVMPMCLPFINTLDRVISALKNAKIGGKR